jgi:hypothetical protein
MPKSGGTGRHGLPGLRKRRGQGGEGDQGPGGPGGAGNPAGWHGPEAPRRPGERGLSFFDDLGSHGSFSEAGQAGRGDGGSQDGAGGADDLNGEGRRRRVWTAGRIAGLTGAVAVLAAGGITLAYVGLPGSQPAAGTAQGQGESTVLPLGSRSISQAGSRPEFAGGSASPGPGQPGSPASGPLLTSCQAVAHIGDSTSDGLISPDYLPKKWQRIPARYKHVGAKSVWTNIEGARSIVEVIPGTTNGYDAARQMTRQGFRGCWVLALGTDDTADVAAGSLTGLSTRIHRMMAAADGQPVMWVNVKTLLSSGPYAEANMQRWNNALLRACARYPNMRIYDWAAAAKKRWFISDGIHYTSAGYAARGRLIASALATAFPAQGHSPGCVVS